MVFCQISFNHANVKKKKKKLPINGHFPAFAALATFIVLATICIHGIVSDL